MPRYMSSDKAFGRLVAAGRALLRFDQSQLAKLADVSAATIANIEQGKKSRNSTKKAVREALRLKGIGFCGRGDGTVGHVDKTFITVSLGIY